MFESHGIMSIKYITVTEYMLVLNSCLHPYKLCQIHIRDIQQAMDVRNIYGYLLHNKSFQILCSCVYILFLLFFFHLFLLVGG